jgi:hypothetical protein
MRTVRTMEPRDLPRVWRLAAAQNRRDGTTYPVPRIFEMDEKSPNFGQYLQNVPLALITERDGRVCQAHFFLRTIEVMGFGGGREDEEFSARHIPMALDLLKRRGYGEVHTFVPKIRVSEQHAKLLESHGMTRLDNRLAHFFMTTGV